MTLPSSEVMMRLGLIGDGEVLIDSDRDPGLSVHDAVRVDVVAVHDSGRGDLSKAEKATVTPSVLVSGEPAVPLLEMLKFDVPTPSTAALMA